VLAVGHHRVVLGVARPDVPLDGLGGLALVEHQVVERHDTPLVLFKPVAHRDALPLERCESPRSNPLQMVAARDEDDRHPVVAEALAGVRSDLGIDRKRTPWCSMLISPGVGTLPPPTMPASPVVRRAEGGASTSVARRGSSRPLAPGPSGGSTCLETGTPG